MPSPPQTPAARDRGNRTVSFTQPGSTTISVEEWTIDQTAHLLASTSLSPTAAVNATGLVHPSEPLIIPLDTTFRPSPSPHSAPLPSNLARSPSAPRNTSEARNVHTVYRRRSPIRRDSQKRREALAKGKEGSRRRQRWENDRLLHVPGAQPPLPVDWAQPAWPEAKAGFRPMPYFLAPLWDVKYAAAARERQEAERRGRKVGGLREGRGELGERRGRVRPEEMKGEEEKDCVARELRARMKKARGAKGLLQDLEMEVRNFLMQVETAKRLDDEEMGDESDEEIVFVGRNGSMSDRKKDEEASERAERLIFHSLEKDHGASFGRWLVHSIADYYGLDTWSVTTGNPARREAYVGVKADIKAETRAELPRPLWVLV